MEAAEHNIAEVASPEALDNDLNILYIHTYIHICEIKKKIKIQTRKIHGKYYSVTKHVI